MSLRHNTSRSILILPAVFLGVSSGARPAAAYPQPATTTAYTGSASDPRKDDKQIVEDLHHSVCWVNCSASANGAGWVLDVKQRLVLTSRRVIYGAKLVLVYFPEKRSGKWETDEGYYLKSAKAYSAKIVASDYWHDLALLQLEGLPSTAQALKFAPTSAARGARLQMLSGKIPGQSALWPQSSGLARGVGIGPFYNAWKPRIVVASMFSSSNSHGEPLVNEQGHVVGVVEGATTAEVDGKPLATGGTAIRALDVVQVKSWLGPVLRLVDPQTAADYYERGRRHVDEHRYPQAIDDLSTAIRRDGTLAKAYAERGWAHYYNKDYKGALPDFDKAVQLDGKDDNALSGRGATHHKLKKDADAIRDLNAAIAINSKNWRHYNRRGIVHYESRKYQDALDDFGRAAALDGSQYILFQNKGLAAMQLRLYRTAAGAYQESNRLNPGLAPNHNSEGICYFRLKEYTPAAGKFQDAIKVNPNYWVYHENLGAARQELGKHREAIQAYTQGIRVVSYAPSSLYYNRGLSRMSLKEYADAVSDFTTAIVKNAKNADAHYNRARAYAAQGKTSLATADLDKAKSLDKTRYGSVTLANLGSTTIAKPAGATATGGQGDQNLAGRWHFRQKLNGKDTEIELTFQGDGGYTSKFTVFDETGRGTPSVESGIYTAKDGKLALTPKVGKAVTRSYGFEMGKLWIFFAESRVAVYLERK